MLRSAPCPEGGTLIGLRNPLQHEPTDALGRFLGGEPAEAKSALRVEVRKFPTQTESAVRDLPNPAPLTRHDLEHATHDLLRRYVTNTPHRPRILVLYLGPAFLELFDDHVDTLQDVEGLETGYHDGNVMARGGPLVFLIPCDGANVAGSQEALYPVERRLEQCLDSRGHQHVRHQYGEVRHILAGRLKDGHRVGRRRGLEPHCKEDHLAIRVSHGELQRIERRVDDSHVSTLRLHAQEIAPRAGDAHHVAEGTEGHRGAPRQFDGPVD